MIGSLPTDSKNSSDNRRFTSDTIGAFRRFYESSLKSHFAAPEQQKIEEKMFLKDPFLENLHSSFTSGQITEEQLVEKIKQSVKPTAPAAFEPVTVVIDSQADTVKRVVVLFFTQRSNQASSGPMPEIRLGGPGIETGFSSLTISPTSKLESQRLNSTPELSPVTQKVTPPSFKHNLLNFVLQHEGLGYDVIDSFLKHQANPDHRVSWENSYRCWSRPLWSTLRVDLRTS